MFQEMLLTFRGSPAVAAHRRDDERFQTESGTLLDNRMNDLVDAGDAAAAGGDGNGLAGFDLIPEGKAVSSDGSRRATSASAGPSSSCLARKKERESHGNLLSKRDNGHIL